MKPKAALDFLKNAGPVGARDTRTLTKLKEKGVPTYFSGCLTLTWNPNIRRLSPKPRKQVVVVDTSSGKQGVTTLVPEALLEDSLEYSNHLGSVSRPSFHWPFQFAYGSLLAIAQARLVITSRIKDPCGSACRWAWYPCNFYSRRGQIRIRSSWGFRGKD